MTVTSPRQTEREFQAAVIDLARRCGWLVAHFHDSRRQISPGRFVGDRDAAGFPDCVLVRERIVYAELKGATTRVTAQQYQWIEALGHAGQEVYLWRPRHWPEIEATLAGERGIREPQAVPVLRRLPVSRPRPP